MTTHLRIPVVVGSVRRGRLHKRDDPPPGLVRFSEAIASADAVVIVSPEYNGSMPGVLKNALDYIREDGEPREAHYEKSFAGFVETLEWYARVVGAAAAAERS